ncbi:hypothetical protein DFH09DRAFT_1468742, partial [Mycena vulgaris]
LYQKVLATSYAAESTRRTWLSPQTSSKAGRKLSDWLSSSTPPAQSTPPMRILITSEPAIQTSRKRSRHLYVLCNSRRLRDLRPVLMIMVEREECSNKRGIQWLIPTKAQIYPSGGELDDSRTHGKNAHDAAVPSYVPTEPPRHLVRGSEGNVRRIGDKERQAQVQLRFRRSTRWIYTSLLAGDTCSAVPPLHLEPRTNSHLPAPLSPTRVTSATHPEPRAPVYNFLQRFDVCKHFSRARMKIPAGFSCACHTYVERGFFRVVEGWHDITRIEYYVKHLMKVQDAAPAPVPPSDLKPEGTTIASTSAWSVSPASPVTASHDDFLARFPQARCVRQEFPDSPQ